MTTILNRRPPPTIIGIFLAIACPAMVLGQQAAASWDGLLRLPPVAFENELGRLQRGPSYAAQVRRGWIERVRIGEDGVRYPYVLVVPPNYTPDRAWPVLVGLHGGVGRAGWKEEDFFAGSRRGMGRSVAGLIDSTMIAVFPAGWRDALWWSPRQVANLHAILDEVKDTYNVDENRVHLLGISDGGSGAWFFASRDPTMWASFSAWISHPAVVGTERSGAEGDFFPRNVMGKPLYVINNEDDPLYPARTVFPVIEALREGGARITFHRHPGGHEAPWLGEEMPSIRAFLSGATRDPYPQRIRWETGYQDRYDRNHWIEVLELGAVPGETPIADALVFRRIRPSGVIEALRDGNTFTVRTRGVRRFRVLLSPAMVDFDRPVRVVVNGRTAVERKATPDVSVLRRWAERDRDRSMLFGAELEVAVPTGP